MKTAGKFAWRGIINFTYMIGQENRRYALTERASLIMTIMRKQNVQRVPEKSKNIRT